MNTAASAQCITIATILPHNNAETISAEPLTEDNRQEVLNFLSLRPVNNVILAGWIRDHGIMSPKHRGIFYGCRDENGDLSGIAMIGPYLLFEARTDEAVIAFARCAQKCPRVEMIFTEAEILPTFWRHYRPDDPMPRASTHRLIRSGGTVHADVEMLNELRIATREDLDQIVSAHAEMVHAETGVDPLKADAEGFRSRCAGRVDRGRVWVLMKDGELIFKTDVVSVTPEAVYIEGLWVNPKERGQRHSTRGMASLCRQLETGSNVICGFVDAEHALYNSLYRKAGFSEVDEYAKIYL